MVRAATTGGFDYRGADPYNKQWRLRHTLVLQDVGRLAEIQMCQAAHDHWLAYASHSRLEADSWSKVKSHAADALTGLQHALMPWNPPKENNEQKDTINGKYGKLIDQYHAMVARKKAAREAAEKAALEAQNTDTTT